MTHLLWLLIFETGFTYVLLISLCVKGKAKPTAAASERGFGEHGRSIAGDVESP